MNHPANAGSSNPVFLILFFICSVLSGCTSITTEAPLLTPDDSEQIPDLEGYYYIFPTSSDAPEPQYFQLVLEKESGVVASLYSVNPGPLPVLEKKERSFLRFRKLGDEWFLGQAWDKPSTEERDLFFLKRQGKGAILFIHSDGYTPTLSAFPALSEHVIKEERDLHLDKTAVTTLKQDTLRFLAREFVDSEINLKALSEIGPTDKKTAYSFWCGQATDDLYGHNYFEKDELKQKIHYAVFTCDQAIQMSPRSVPLYKAYGRALHRAGRFSEAIEWLNKK